MAGRDGEYCDAERAGGEIVVFNNPSFPFTGMDPFQLYGGGAYGGDFAGAFYDNVIRYDATTDTYEPSIAKSWQSNDDNSVWTLKLRDDVTFSNGDPFTAAHIAAHLERMKESSVAASAMAVLVDEIEIVSDHEMVVTLSTPFDFRYMMASQLGWVPNKNLVERRGKAIHGNPVGAGAGAYELEHLSDAAGESLVLAAKDDWWGGDVCIQRIEFQNVPEFDAATEAFLRGEADSLMVYDQLELARLEDQGLMAYQVDVGGMGYIVTDQGISGRSETPYQDVRVREALQLAIDYDAIHQRIFEGTDPAPSSAIVPESSSLWHGVEGPPHDPERAANLVEATAADGTWDGSFTFTHSDDPRQREIAVLLEGMWEAVGMDVTLDATPSAASKVIVDQDFEVASLGFGVIPPQPWYSINLVHCDSPRKRAGYCNPDMDAALESLRGAVTRDEALDAMAEIQQVWNDTFPLAIYRHGVYGVAAQPHLRGLKMGQGNAPYYDDAWLADG